MLFASISSAQTQLYATDISTEPGELVYSDIVLINSQNRISRSNHAYVSQITGTLVQYLLVSSPDVSMST